LQSDQPFAIGICYLDPALIHSSVQKERAQQGKNFSSGKKGLARFRVVLPVVDKQPAEGD